MLCHLWPGTTTLGIPNSPAAVDLGYGNPMIYNHNYTTTTSSSPEMGAQGTPRPMWNSWASGDGSGNLQPLFLQLFVDHFLSLQRGWDLEMKPRPACGPPSPSLC